MADMELPGTNGPVSSDLKGELERAKAQAKQLAEENTRLKQQLQEVQIERDDFLGALRYHAPGQFFTKEDLAEYRKNAISSEQMTREIEEMLKESK
jgi:hypothetical protein